MSSPRSSFATAAVRLLLVGLIALTVVLGGVAAVDAQVPEPKCARGDVWCHRERTRRWWIPAAGVLSVLGGAALIVVARLRVRAALRRARLRRDRYLPGPADPPVAPPVDLPLALLADDPALLALMARGEVGERPTLLLVDAGDHDARWHPVIDAVADAFARGGTPLRRAWFDGTFERCGHDRHVQRVARFSELVAGDVRLLVVGDASRVIDPRTGASARWWDEASARLPPSSWWLLPRPLPSLPAARRALGGLVCLARFGAPALASMRRSGAPEGDALDDQRPPLARGVTRRPDSPLACDALALHLGTEGFRCLCAGAVSARPDPWTAYTLGRSLGAAPSTEDTLRLLALPLWDDARWPSELRSRLLARLPDAKAARERWRSTLRANEPPSRESLTWLWWRLDLLDQQLALGEPVPDADLSALRESPISVEVEAIAAPPIASHGAPPAGVVMGVALALLGVALIVAPQPSRWVRLVAACDVGWADCADARDGCETAVADDRRNCGACGVRCALGRSCERGRCVSPPSPSPSPSASPSPSPPPAVPAPVATLETCPAPLTRCPEGCRDLSKDGANCGACGRSCGGRACDHGRCPRPCPEGTTVCRGVCVNLRTDPLNCGRCGERCPPAPSAPMIFSRPIPTMLRRAPASVVCNDGRCGLRGSPGSALCDGRYRDLNSDAQNCGSCGRICPAPVQGRAVCAGGQCGVTCDVGYRLEALRCVPQFGREVTVRVLPASECPLTARRRLTLTFRCRERVNPVRSFGPVTDGMRVTACEADTLPSASLTPGAPSDPCFVQCVWAFPGRTGTGDLRCRTDVLR